MLKEKLKKLPVFLLCSIFFGSFFISIVFNVDAQSSTASAGFVFSRDLKEGDVGEDVRELQKFLNRNPATMVANDGPGSPGKETTYFGLLTRWAVVTFQEAHKSEILLPNGLTFGTGFVGRATRTKLNALLGEVLATPVSVAPISTISVSTPTTQTPQNSLLTQNPVNPPTEANLQKIYGVSKYQVRPGDTIEIKGVGFSKEKNILHIGYTHSAPLFPSFSPPEISTQSSGGSSSVLDAPQSFTVTIPGTFPIGKYEIWFTTDKNESSKNFSAPIYISVTNNPQVSPNIEKISPTLATMGDEILVSGSGFTENGNNIYSSLGNISNISSIDGKLIKVKVLNFPQVTTIQKYLGGKSLEMDAWLYIQNENGVSKSPGMFKIKL